MMKRCRACGRDKPLSEFYRRATAPDGRRMSCKICAARHRNRVRLAYGFASREEYEAQRDAASCAICGVRHSARPLVFDHNHQTGVNRGWLCGVHNSGLGFFQDDPGLLRAAIAYLEKHS